MIPGSPNQQVNIFDQSIGAETVSKSIKSRYGHPNSMPYRTSRGTTKEMPPVAISPFNMDYAMKLKLMEKRRELAQRARKAVHGK